MLSRIFSPIMIGNMQVKNRLVMPSMSVNFGVDKDGYVTDQLTEFFVARAKGGTGMLIVGGGGVDPIGHELPELPALWDLKCIPALKRMTSRVKNFDVKFGMQLMHGGRQTYNEVKEAPSPIPAPAVVKGVPREISFARIGELVEAFGNSAQYCMEGGFDFVEIHAAHGYLINQFLAPNSNMRTDSYGGIYENRIKFLLDILKRIREKTSSKLVVGVRINAEDYIKNGWNINDSLKLAPILEQEGADYISISAGVYGSTQLTIPSMYVEQGCFVSLAKKIKSVVSIPVIAVGRIRDIEFAERQIEHENADLIAMGRAHLADPEIANKAKKGDLRQIRPCIGCCLGCIHRVLSLESATCVVNPEVGREYQFKIPYKTSKNTRKILLIVGSGLSGLTVAREASIRGHSVIVLEKSGNIGGSARLAAIPPGRQNIMDIVFFFEQELERLNVEVRLNVRLSKNLIDQINPDEIVVATGSLIDIPLIKGLSKTKMLLCTASDILKKKIILGEKIVILGGNHIGLTVADYIAEQGKKVIILHRGNHFAESLASNDRFYLRERLKKNKVKLYKRVSIDEILDDKIIVRHEKQKMELSKVDNLVISEKMKPEKSLVEIIKNSGVKSQIIEYTDSPGNIINSIENGYEIGSTV